jgi:nicotinate-nucleotide adenylyltransferase
VTKVGLFGGSFNPPHLGHLIVVGEVLSALNLDKILFIPTYIPPHKEADLPAEERYKMTGMAISGNPRFEISDIEMKRGGISYTADTLRELRDLFREVEFYLIMGADEFSEIENWREPEAVLSLSKVVVMGRPGCELGEVGQEYLGKFLKVDVPLIGISSSDIRKRVKEGRSIAYLVPPGVEEYIREKDLYR